MNIKTMMESLLGGTTMSNPSHLLCNKASKSVTCCNSTLLFSHSAKRSLDDSRVKNLPRSGAAVLQGAPGSPQERLPSSCELFATMFSSIVSNAGGSKASKSRCALPRSTTHWNLASLPSLRFLRRTSQSAESFESSGLCPRSHSSKRHCRCPPEQHSSAAFLSM